MAALAAKDNIKRLAKRRILILLVLAVLACFGGIISIMKGSVNVPLNEIIAAMTGGSAGMHQQIILNIRLPRTIVAGLVGVNLALSGAILQAVMKNPLADPHIIGISAGAGIMGIFIMLLFPDLSWLITPAAFAGAMGAAILIYILAWKNGIQPIRIILAGVAVSAFLGAGISALMIIYSDRVHSALMWMVGGLSARSWPQVMIIWPYTLAGMIFTLLAARHLNILQLGDELAKGLGLRVERTRLILTAAAALLAASAVSVVGLLGFVGLIVPHAARLMIGSDYRYLLPATIFLGAATVMLSDTFARVAFAPVELPVGIIMAAIGAPFFLFLLRREL
ncbi:MAG: iron ABC transporter permease [Selenomonas sp.]|nr:iron ABC transporter permease [Selenomonadales bacterium]MDD7762839.1 iron ABC transporter permease [Selenomonadales bacterium]MDY5716344.1 iron ABC transporter permease [Selenomonas sp.]